MEVRLERHALNLDDFGVPALTTPASVRQSPARRDLDADQRSIDRGGIAPRFRQRRAALFQHAGADTIFTSGISGRISAASAVAVSGWVLRRATSPSYSISIASSPSSAICPAKVPSFSIRSSKRPHARRFFRADGCHVERVGQPPPPAGNPTSARRPAARRSPGPRWCWRQDAGVAMKLARQTTGFPWPAPMKYIESGSGDMPTVESRAQRQPHRPGRRGPR